MRWVVVLFGTRRDDLIRILTWRPMACDHTQGEGLRLSYNDRMNLAVQLEMARQNADLKDLRPVGWFVSHSSGGISLSDSDLEIYNGFFPESWQAALVIRPTGSGRAQAGFFMREADGKVQSEASYHTFELAPLKAAVSATKVAVAPAPEAAPPQPPPGARPKEPEVTKTRSTRPEDIPAPSSEAAALQAAAFRAAAFQALPPPAPPLQAPSVPPTGFQASPRPAPPLKAPSVPPTAYQAPPPPAPPSQAPSVPPTAFQASLPPAPPPQASSVPPTVYQAPPPPAPPPQAPAFPAPAFQGRALQAPALQAPTFQIDEQLPTRERWYVGHTDPAGARDRCVHAVSAAALCPRTHPSHFAL